MKKCGTILATTVAIVVAGNAFAADLGGYAASIKDEPVARSNWTGFYVGAHGGYAGSADWGLDLSHTTGALIYNDPFPADANSLSDDDGWFGGLQLGANYQRGLFIFGIEADVSWADLSADGAFITVPGNTLWDVSSELEVFGTLRGRLGYLATSNVLLYGTGGLAWGIVDTQQATTHNPGGNAMAGARTSGDSSHIGYAIGAGGEFSISPNVTIKAEYLYVDLGEEGVHLKGTVSPTDPTPWSESFEQDLDFHTFRVGLNYKFGAR